MENLWHDLEFGLPAKQKLSTFCINNSPQIRDFWWNKISNVVQELVKTQFFRGFQEILEWGLNLISSKITYSRSSRSESVWFLLLGDFFLSFFLKRTYFLLLSNWLRGLSHCWNPEKPAFFFFFKIFLLNLHCQSKIFFTHP